MLIRIFSATLLFIFLQNATATANKGLAVQGSNWPTEVSFPDDIMVEIVNEGTGSETSLYRTNHFELISELPLSRDALCQILEVMEATLASWQVLPLGAELLRPLDRYSVRLVSDESSFVNEGGIRGAGGVYLPESRQTLIRIDSLQPEIGTDGAISNIRKRSIIAHEITHQIQHDWLDTLPIWLIEGMAMYLESAPYHHGSYAFAEGNFKVAAGIRRATQNHYWIIDLERLMTMSRAQWHQGFTENPNENNRYYQSAYLLTYYFMHLSGQKDASGLRTFIQQMQQAGRQEERIQATKALLEGRSYAQLQQALSRAYATKDFIVEPLHGHPVDGTSSRL
jgi:hypothetical protein